MNATPSLDTTLSLIIGIAVIASAVVAQVVYILIMVRRRSVAPQSCGDCGYDVRGLTTFSCPECGRDLREVGITRGQSFGPGFYLVIFALDLLVVAVILVLFIS